MFLSHHRAVIPFPHPHCMISLIEQVCIAMVPGGCVIKHPLAELAAGASLERNESFWLPKNCADINHLKFTFWMHNARGFRFPERSVNDIRYMFDKNDCLRKEHFVDEAVEYFKKLWNAPQFRNFHPSLVFLPFVAALLYPCIVLDSCFNILSLPPSSPLPSPISVGRGPVRPHWRQVDRRPERTDFFRFVEY